MIDYEAVSFSLSGVNWSDVLLCECPTKAATKLDSVVGTVISKSSKMVKISHSKFAIDPWMWPGLIRCSKHRDRLQAEVRKGPENQIKKRTFTRYRNFYIDVIRKVKGKYDSEALNKNINRHKKLCECIGTITHTHRNNIKSRDLTKIKERPTASLDYCNDYFVSTGHSLADKIMHNMSETEESLAAKVVHMESPVESFFLFPTDAEEVETRIRLVKADSAPGIDGLSKRVLKVIGKSIAVPLAHICNSNLSAGIFFGQLEYCCCVPHT